MPRRYSRRKSAPRRSNGNGIGVLSIAAGANAAFQLGFVDAAATLFDGGSMSEAINQVRDNISFSSIIASATPFVALGLMKKFIGQKTIYGKIKLF